MLVPRADFTLDSNFIAGYEGLQPKWGNLGYLVYKRTYALEKPDGTTEEFWETCKRVVEGVYQTQKGHCTHHNLPWNDRKAQRSAQEMYERMWLFKFLPPGRGLSKMGTDILFRIGGACLNNCGFVTTRDIGNPNIDHAFAAPFVWLMNMSMVGVGVGFDTKGAGTVRILKPKGIKKYVVADSREGWCDYLRELLQSMVAPDVAFPLADYRLVRAKGAPIKGFGGTSSGPEALQLMTKRLCELADAYVDKEVDARFIVDVANTVGECVVSGGVRRTAEIAFGHPKDEQFLRLKDFGEGDDSEVEPHQLEARTWPRWASNNSFIVDMMTDFSTLADSTSRNGEPGYLFLDNARKYGRMIDPPNNADHRAMGANPCVVGTTWVHTTEGPKQIKSLLGKQFDTVIDGTPYSSTSKGGFQTGTKPVYLLKTAEGHSIELTGNHQVLTCNKLTRKKRYEAWVEAQDLSPGDMIILSDNSTSTWEGKGTSKEGWLLGALLGDGHFHANGAKLEFWGSTRETLFAHAVECIGDNRRSVGEPGYSVPARSLKGITSKYVETLSAAYGITTDKDILEESLFATSSSFYEGFLKGLFDSDGSVQGTQEKGVSVRLSSINRQHLCVVQKMLLALGINSTLYEDRRAACLRTLPGGEYDCHSSHELIIANNNLEVFNSRVGFVDTEKASRLNTALSSYARSLNRERFVATVQSLTYTRVEPVYDCTVPAVSRFVANGIVVHNCVEQTLENYELCCLVETFPSMCEDYDDYQRTLKFAYLYAKTVTLIPTQSAETNAVMLRNRRIGCSQSGIQDNIERVGLNAHLAWCDLGYKYIKELDQIYSDWLCIPRSIKSTSVKPSGSVSKLPGVREGIHESKGEYEMQTIRLNDNSALIPRLEAANYRIEKDVKAPNTVVVYFPMHYNRTRARNPSMWEQLEMAALMQAYWADNQVSVTIDFDRDTEGPEIERALNMYASRLKGLSFLPRDDHGYAQPPKAVITKEEYAAYKAQLGTLDFSNLNTHEVEDKFCDGGVCEIELPIDAPPEAVPAE